MYKGHIDKARGCKGVRAWEGVGMRVGENRDKCTWTTIKKKKTGKVKTQDTAGWDTSLLFTQSWCDNKGLYQDSLKAEASVFVPGLQLFQY